MLFSKIQLTGSEIKSLTPDHTQARHRRRRREREKEGRQRVRNLLRERDHVEEGGNCGILAVVRQYNGKLDSC